MNNGKEFEELVAIIEKVVHDLPGVKVLHNVKLPTNYGSERQIDILITQESGRFVFNTIIECKNLKSKITLNAVGAFKELKQSVGAHQGIIVSANGFQKGAVDSAKEANIFLYQLSQVSDLEEYLTGYFFNQFELKHTSKEVVVKFIDKKTINKDVSLYSNLYSSLLKRNVRLVDIAQNFLTKNQSAIMRTIANTIEYPGKSQILNGTTNFNINFPSALTFTKDNIETEIIGFDAVVETQMLSIPYRIKNILEYNDILKSKTHALVFDLEYEGVVYKYIQKNIV